MLPRAIRLARPFYQRGWDNPKSRETALSECGPSCVGLHYASYGGENFFQRVRAYRPKADSPHIPYLYSPQLARHSVYIIPAPGSAICGIGRIHSFQGHCDLRDSLARVRDRWSSSCGRLSMPFVSAPSACETGLSLTGNRRFPPGEKPAYQDMENQCRNISALLNQSQFQRFFLLHHPPMRC